MIGSEGKFVGTINHRDTEAAVRTKLHQLLDAPAERMGASASR
jgi:hypothetical protein